MNIQEVILLFADVVKEAMPFVVVFFFVVFSGFMNFMVEFGK